MRSSRGKGNNPERVKDNVNQYSIDDVQRRANYQMTSSDEEDELSQLKPNLHNHSQQQQQHTHQQHKSSKKNGSSKKNHEVGGGRGRGSSGNGSDINSHHLLLSAGQSEDAASPNGSDNTYAEASLLPHTSSNMNEQDMRYNQGIV